MADALQTTRIYLEGFEADLSDETTIPITYAIKTIDDIASSASTYTKTITLPGTARNNALFDFFFNIKSTGPLEGNFNSSLPNIGYNYNLKKRIKATIIKDCQVMFEGYAQMISATITNGLISYDIQISSPLTAFAAILSGNNPINQQAYRLEDIPDSLTSGFTHDVTVDNITNSWTATPSTSYLYPLIDYGQHDSVNYSCFYLTDMRPCLYAKQYWDLIFEAAGFTYQSNFINSDYFKRLVCPYKEGNITIDSNGVNATSTLSGSTLVTEARFLPTDRTPIYIFNDAIADPEGLYDDTNRKFVPNLSGLYAVSLSALYYFVFTPSNTSVTVTNTGQDINVNFEVYATSTNTLLSTLVQTVNIPFNGYGNWTGVWDTRNPRPGSSAGDTVVNSLVLTNVPVYVNSGEYLKISISAGNSMPDSEVIYEQSSHQYIGGTVDLGIINATNAAAPNLSISYTNILDNSTLTYQSFCLKDVTQLDFIKSIVRLFNLYIEQDKDNPFQLNFWTRDEFYSDQKVLDWTNKVDHSQDITVKPLPNLQNNTFLYSYRSDSDWWNTQYTAQYGGGTVNSDGSGITGGSVYGQQLLAINYDFSTTQLDVLSDSVFSPTIPVQAANNIYNSESTVEILDASKSVISVSGYSTWSGNAAGTQPAPSGNGFAKARAGGKISYWGQIYTIIALNNAYSFSVDRNVTRTPGQVNATFYAVTDTFSYVTDNTKTIPAIYQTADNNVTRSPLKVNPRLLYYSGLVTLPTTPTSISPSGETWQIQSTPIVNPADSFTYTFVNGIPEVAILKHYPVVHHWNDLNNPTQDLLFGAPSALFFPGIYPPNLANLFTFYWENALNEIIDNEAKLVTLYLKLNSVDISPLDLSEIIYINGTNYKINQIIDFAADRSTTTQVELIRLPFQQVNTLPLPNPPTTTTTTTTIAPTTTTTIAPENVTFNICNNAPGTVSVTGFVTTNHPVFTDVTVNITVVDSTLASHTTSTTVTTGNSSASWGAAISTGSSIDNITITSVSPTSFGSQTYIVGSWVGSCSPTTTTTLTPTTTTSAPTTTTTIAPTTTTLAPTTTTLAPTAIVFNDGRGSTLSSVTGIAGFTCGTVTFGNEVTGFHSAFTGAITVNISVGSSFAGNLFLFKNGATAQTITTAAGFSGSKVFTSASYLSTDQIEITFSA